MSKNEKTDTDRVGPVIHPCVSMAVLLAQKVYSNRSTSITPGEFEGALDAVCVGDAWNDPPVDMRTFVLMVQAALQFGLWIEANVTAEHFRVAAAASDLEARAHAVLTAGAIASLGGLANHLAETARR